MLDNEVMNDKQLIWFNKKATWPINNMWLTLIQNEISYE